MITNKTLIEREVRTAPIHEVRVAKNDDGSHSVSGYAIVFGTRSVDLGGFTEVVSPDALTRTLKANPDVLCLRDHKQELLLGRTKAGTLRLNTDERGLNFSCDLPNTTTGNDLAESLRRGDIDSCSFGFTTVSDSWRSDGKSHDVRTLNDIDLFEISVVSFPAYEATTASLRSAPVEVRSRIEAVRAEKRDVVDPADEACLCPCPECASGDCSNCSDADCDCEGCDCDNDAERTRVQFQKRSEACLQLLELMTRTNQ